MLSGISACCWHALKPKASAQQLCSILAPVTMPWSITCVCLMLYMFLKVVQLVTYQAAQLAHSFVCIAPAMSQFF